MNPIIPPITYGRHARGFTEWYTQNFQNVQECFTMPVEVEDEEGKPKTITASEQFEDIESFGLEMFMEMKTA